MADAILYAPKVRYTNTFESQFDAMMTWRAELELSYHVEDDTPDVLAGSADFLIIRVGEHPIGDLLESLSEETARFAELFDGDDVAGEVQDQFDDAPFNRILIITDVAIAGPLRGHGLGAWLVAEVIDRMASPTDTLVLLQAEPAGQASPSEVSALSKYWERVGLEVIQEHREFMGQATAYSHLGRARAALSAIADAEFTVSTSRIREEKPNANLRHAVTTDDDPQPPLRLVRS